MTARMSQTTPSVQTTWHAPLRAHPLRTVFAVLLIALVLLILLWDWNWFKRPIERIVETRTGRVLQIGGNLDVDLGRVTTVRADALKFANAAWSKDPTMASVERLELQIEVLPLLRGQTRLPEIRLTRPVLQLETNPDGSDGNWALDLGGDEGGDPMQLRRLWIDDGRFRFLDTPGGTDIQVVLASQEARETDAAPPIGVSGGGTWSRNRFTLEGTAASPLDLQDTEAPYRIDLRARAGATRAHARGTLVDPLQLRDFDLQFALSGQNLDHLYPLVGVALPDTPPYALDGRLTRDGQTWHYDGFTGRVGQSDLGGDVAITVGAERPFLKADLVSTRLDLDDLAGFLGGAPQAEGDDALDPELVARAEQLASKGKMIPDTPYELDKLRAMDADVRLRAQRINAPELPIDDMDAHLTLDAGMLQLEPLNFGVAGGDIRSTIRLDARQDTIQTRLQATVRRVELGGLFADSELAKQAVGRISGSFNIAGTGNSIAAMLGSADGDIAVGMGEGRISNLLVELAGLDIFESLKYLIGEDKQIPIRCAFADFGVQRGVMDARALAFDTSDTIIVGKGQVSLRDETLDLELRPRPKDRSIFALRSPLVVGGSFASPSFRPDLKRLGLRGAIALALGSIAPPAALLATLELGGGEDSSCGGDYAQ